MIHRIYSDHPKFKTVLLRPGMNILVATKSKGAASTDTRNGAGKSSLVEIVHFVLGADVDKRSIFKCPELESDTFGLEFDLAGVTIRAERSGKRPSRVILRDIPREWIANVDELDLVDSDGSFPIHVDRWIELLGSFWFQLPFTRPEAERKFSPTYRSLFAYFCRRPDGFVSPSRTYPKQPIWQEQVLVSFLLGLDWRIPQAQQRLRTKKKFRHDLRKALEDAGDDNAGLPTSSALQTALALAEDRARGLERALAEFRIVDEYHELEREANEITQLQGQIADENSFDRAAISNLLAVQATEAPSDAADLAQLFKEAGVVLPKQVKRRFDDVQAFHASVIKNRQAHLQQEVKAAESRLIERGQTQRQADRRYAEIWNILKNAGALESFIGLQQEFGRMDAQANSLRTQLQQAQDFEESGREIFVEESRLETRLVMNLEEQRDQMNRAIITFGNVSQRLYSERGHLQISRKLSGPPIDVQIPRVRSEGVASMQIFCFDLTMIQFCLHRNIGPGFLIHDSHLYDPVDSRQVGHALRVAAELTTDEAADSQLQDDGADDQFQYLTMLNSDKLDQVVAENVVDLKPWILPVDLSDDPAGGLFGRPFDSRPIASR